MDGARKRVRISYTGTLDDGSVFDSSDAEGGSSIYYCGSYRMPRTFDETVRSLAVGETRTVRVPAGEAYGEYDPQKVRQLPLAQFTYADQLVIGQTIDVKGPG